MAERYLLHDFVQNEKDAREFQEHCTALGYEPLSSSELDDMRDQVATLVSRFGPEYRQLYGWAAPLRAPNGRVTFRDLEVLADLDHLRPLYGLANHDVHADAKGARLNRLEFGDGHVRLAGPSNAGLADPGQSAAISLLQTTVALVVRGRPEIGDASDIPMLHALSQLTSDACDRFIEAHLELRTR